MAPLPKPADRRQRRNKRPSMSLVPTSDTRPALPRGWLRAVESEWDAFWMSNEGKATRRVEWPLVCRLFALMDQWLRAERTVRKQGPTVAGSQGQVVAHPLIKVMRECERALVQIEDRLGISRRAMVALGASYASAQKRMDDIQETYTSDDDADDPRIAAIR